MNEDEQGALDDPRPMPWNHGSPHQGICKAAIAASVPLSDHEWEELCLEFWHSLICLFGFRLQASICCKDTHTKFEV
jgi:hypothetical protein